MGDRSGIGPEIIAAALGQRSLRAKLLPVVFGDLPSLMRFPLFKSFRVCDPPLGGRPDAPTLCAVTRLSARARTPGKPSAEGGTAQLNYVLALVEAAKRGQGAGLCTAPGSKGQTSRLGVGSRGDTE